MSTAHTVTLTLQDLSARVGGRLQGDPQTRVCGICALDDSHPSLIAFIKESHATVVSRGLQSSHAGVYLVHESLEGSLEADGKNLIFVKDPYAALVSLVPLFRPSRPPARGVSARAEVPPSAKLGANVSIGAFCVLGERVEIGDETVIHPNVTIYSDVRIGAHCVIHAGAVIREDSVLGNHSVVQPGAVIGSDGFGYVPDPQLGLRAIPQVGGVELADFVDIGANSCVDRGTIGNTRIGRATKLDNLVQVGHNVRIGQFGILCGQVGIGGSTTIGDRVTCAGQSGVGDHVTICSDVRLAAKTGAVTPITEKGDYAGYPHLPAGLFMRNAAILRRLPELLKDKLSRRKPKEDS